MNKIFFGSSPLTSIIGYVASALITIDELTSAGETNWFRITLAVAIAILGRVQKDSDGKDRNGNAGSSRPITARGFMVLIFVGVLFAGCSQKMAPTRSSFTQIATKDSVIIKETVSYRTDTLHLPGDTLEIGVAIPCPDAKLDTTIKNGRSTLNAKLLNGLLNVNCFTDSLLHIVDSLENRLRETFHDRSATSTTVKEVPVEVIKYRVPRWCWWLLAANVLMVLWRFRSRLKRGLTNWIK
jgi:hypothetical protein